MMSVVMQSERPFLSAVATLNVQRRNDALYLLSRDSGRPLTPYDICKTQVLADVLHVVKTGRVIFGGILYAMPFGPVAEGTLDDCRQWATGLMFATMLGRVVAEEKQPLEPSGWTGLRNHIPEFRASQAYSRRDEASWDWFSEDEQAHVRAAHEKVMRMSWQQSQTYFHNPVSAIGYAYEVATRPFPKPFKKRVEMNWFDVLEGAEKTERADCSYAREMLGLWT